MCAVLQYTYINNILCLLYSTGFDDTKIIPTPYIYGFHTFESKKMMQKPREKDKNNEIVVTFEF